MNGQKHLYGKQTNNEKPNLDEPEPNKKKCNFIGWN